MCQYTVLSTGMTSCCFGLAVVLQWVKTFVFSSRTCPAGGWGRWWWILWMCAAGVELVRLLWAIQFYPNALISSFLFISLLFSIAFIPLSPGPSQILQVADSLSVHWSTTAQRWRRKDDGGGGETERNSCFYPQDIKLAVSTHCSSPAESAVTHVLYCMISLFAPCNF